MCIDRCLTKNSINELLTTQLIFCVLHVPIYDAKQIKKFAIEILNGC
jgi:hypothetical protein